MIEQKEQECQSVLYAYNEILESIATIVANTLVDKGMSGLEANNRVALMFLRIAGEVAPGNK